MTAPFLAEVVVVSATKVTLIFDQNLLDEPIVRDPLSYSFDGGLFVEGVTHPAADRVSLSTSPMVPGRSYRVTASGGLRNAGLEYLNVHASSLPFAGPAVVASLVVTNLQGRPYPGGGRVDLLWDNPPGLPTHCKIIRRLRSWVFDETDRGDVVFSGVFPAAVPPGGPLITSGLHLFTDGTAAFVDKGVVELEFYYYVVLVGDGILQYTITDASRVLVFVGATSFDALGFLKTKAHLPKKALYYDNQPPQTGELNSYLSVMAGWLRQMWSATQSLKALSDGDRMPYTVLPDQVLSRGFEAEGGKYDFDTFRRCVLMLREVYATKGTIPTISEAAWMLVHWLTILQEFGVGSRSRVLTTWIAGTTLYVAAPTAWVAGTITEGVAVWVLNQWQDARYLDVMGNWLDIESNTPTVLTVKAPLLVAPWSAAVVGGPYAAGSNSVVLSSVAGLVVGQRIQLWNRTSGRADVMEIDGINPGTHTLSFWNKTQNIHTAVDSVMTWDITEPQGFMVGTAPGGEPAGTLTPTSAGLRWQTDQWVGFTVRDAAAVDRTVVSNTATSMILTPATVVSNGDFRISRSVVATPPPIGTIYGGEWHFLFHPLFDYELRGTRLDPYSYLYGGPSPLGGAWGSGDLGLYVTGNSDPLFPPFAAVGRVSSIPSPDKIVDPSAAYVVNELVGMWLNPNQNQTRLFRIISNTPTTITIEGDLSLIALVPMPYVVFTDRNATRYQRLVKRIQEFTPDDTTVRVLFI